VNLVAGAKTAEHVDSMRSNAPTYLLLIEPNSGFELRVQKFPSFKTSVVLYKGKKYIPHEYSPEYLIMIGLQNKGNKPEPYFYKFQPSVIEQLQPFGDIHEWIVVGIKDQQLQLLERKNCAVHPTTNTLHLKPISEIFRDAGQHATKPVGRKKFLYLKKTHEFCRCFGWMHAHRLLRGSNHKVQKTLCIFQINSGRNGFSLY
jgi:hypothetical protein